MSVFVPIVRSSPDIVRSPAIVTFAPAIVIAVVPEELLLMTSSPLLFVSVPKRVPPSFKKTSAPSASNVISVDESRVKAPVEFTVIGEPARVAPVVPSWVIVKSLPAPMLNTELSLVRLRSSPTVASPAMATLELAVVA